MSVACGGLRAFALALCRPIGGIGNLRHRVAIFITATLLAAGNSQAMEVITNTSVPISELSQLELRAIYTMRLDRWSSGSEIRVFVLPQKDERHQEFAKTVLQALPHQLQAVWYRLVYSGMGSAPTEVKSEQEMIERVSETPGAIGYVGKGNNVTNVQVIKIETSS
ncbi:MAG: hypothetical protein CL583_18410 [Alteromonadaceae bacterium]|nr:hypothetical protein [Alteromonadaceae bacterium]|tara:strand:+ start:1091 stop:1588 length:498 start_codon:yes stop_codon:yes gene_type:complete